MRGRERTYMLRKVKRRKTVSGGGKGGWGGRRLSKIGQRKRVRHPMASTEPTIAILRHIYIYIHKYIYILKSPPFSEFI
jgi:hypothetical protein